MGELILSEISSFLNPAQKLPGFFHDLCTPLIQGIYLGRLCVYRKNRHLMGSDKNWMEFWQANSVHALTPHRTGSPPEAALALWFFSVHFWIISH